jgi:hypothetical protein
LLTSNKVFHKLWFLDKGLLLTIKLLNQGFLLVRLKSSLYIFHDCYHALVDRYGICVTNDHEYVPLIVNTSRSFPSSRLITGTIYPSGAPAFTLSFSGVRVAQSLVLCVCFIYSCVSFCTFSFGHCVVCSSSIYGLWLPLWYLQTSTIILNRQSDNLNINLVWCYLHFSCSMDDFNFSMFIFLCVHNLVCKFIYTICSICRYVVFV